MIWYCRFVTSSVLYAEGVWFPMSLSAVLGCRASTCWRSAVMMSMRSWSLWRFVMGVCFGLLYMFIIFVVRFVIIYFRLFYKIFLERIFSLFLARGFGFLSSGIAVVLCLILLVSGGSW